MRNLFIFLLFSLLSVSCIFIREAPKEEVSLHDLLQYEFFYLLDTTRYIVDERSYIHDTLEMYIASLVIIHPKEKDEKLNLRKVGFSDDFHSLIDTVKTQKSDVNTFLLYPKAPFYPNYENLLPGYVIVGVPINIDIARRSLMKSIKLSLNERRVIFYDTVSHSFYFYKSKFYKPSIF